MLAGPTRTPSSSASRALADTSDETPPKLARAGAALRALGRFQDANAAFRDASAAAPGDAAIQTAWGDLFLEKYNKAEALKSFPAALRDRRALGAGARRSARARSRTTIRRRRSRSPSARSRSTRSSVDAHVFLAEQAVDADHRDEARELLTRRSP